MNSNRRLLVLGAVPVALALTGCASPPPPPRDQKVTYCYRSKLERYIKGPCISEPIPSLDADARSKRFEADPDHLTVFVVRKNRADGQNLVQVLSDDQAAVETLPDTLVRIRFKPGTHKLALKFEDQYDLLSVQGLAGEVRFVRLMGSGLSWRVRYRWAVEDDDGVRQRALKTRLVADVLIP